MSRSFLFGGQPNSQQSKYLVEFRAGKMTARDNTITANRKKGLVYLNQTDDNLMHFCWKDRTSGAVEDDLIIFPDDAEFKKVAQCKTGRVYVLLFKSSNRRCFYWMQEPSEDRDDELCRKVNEYLNNPPALGSRSASASSTLASVNNLAELGNLPEHDLQNLFNTVTPQQLMQMLTSVNGMSSPGMLSGLLNQTSGRSGSSKSSTTSATNTTPSATSTTTVPASASGTSTATGSSTAAGSTSSGNAASAKKGSTPGIKLSVLQNIVSDLQAEQSKRSSAESTATSIPLTSVLNSDALRTLLANQDFMRRVRDLLPESSDLEASAQLSEQTLPEQFTSTFKSPQFNAALQTFHAAFQLGSLGPLMSQFNLSARCIDAAERGGQFLFVFPTLFPFIFITFPSCFFINLFKHVPIVTNCFTFRNSF
jgi:26S proteasome regulatory subunit N13